MNIKEDGDRLREKRRAGLLGAITEMLQRVNFPQFVGGLIDGVFNAIVDSSIKRREACGIDGRRETRKIT